MSQVHMPGTKPKDDSIGNLMQMAQTAKDVYSEVKSTSSTPKPDPKKEAIKRRVDANNYKAYGSTV